jgi:hypothetical protein
MRVSVDEARGLVEVVVPGDYTEEGIDEVYAAYDRLAAARDRFGQVDVVEGPGRGFSFRAVLQGAKGASGALKLKRYAIVTDTSARGRSAARFLSLFGVDCRVFPAGKEEEAKAWAAGA